MTTMGDPGPSAGATGSQPSSKHTLAEDGPPWLGPVTVPLVVGAVCFAGASATRLLDRWEQGRWWALDIGLLAVAAIAALVGIFRAVGGLGDTRRYRAAPRQVVGRAVGLVLIVALAGAVSVRSVDDWETLDVPEAFDRLDVEPDPVRPFDNTTTEIVSDLPVAQAAPGTCFRGEEVAVEAIVACEEEHTLQVLEIVDVADSGEYPGTGELADKATGLCFVLLSNADFGSGVEPAVVVPSLDVWVGGSRQAACAALATEGPTTTLVDVPGGG